ncbi:hypothetical protein G6F70_008124 [Rhizopus microsporus]|uniref:Protein SQS1 n=1 Tax=Rhizopus microsporus TaxID=58291 RepID=A0A1X0RKS6_RHIZD|nr:hypothetical protein G6F71_002231 [Rhizopus microsporus]KAG1195581.1 hypothetical protein G6F70_008124 [Rhizopus microsporus]KAG1207414.1 hypothetical protein G6F69_008069 [Rhizopus microsporus]KAG1228085.1 hypothetical protein G6F67_008044 [Rhizopus microsporus]KAG1260100.1 hypothetical protein G6F68_007676 [Rhizopus microsporus]
MPGRQRGQQRNQRGKRNSHRGRRGMIPTANGFLYEPSYKIDYEDDFRLYAQFGSEDEKEGPQPLSKKGHKNKKPQYSKKNNNHQPQRPIKQKSYHTPVKFTKATTLFEKEEVEKDDGIDQTIRSMTTLRLEDVVGVGSKDGALKEKDESEEEYLNEIEYHEEPSEEEENENDDDIEYYEEEEEEDDDDEEDEEYYDQDAFFYLSDTEIDELLEEDMMIMEDYMENAEFDKDDIHNILQWSAQQDQHQNEEPEFEEYDYDDLDRSNHTQRILTEMEEEEAMMTKENIHGQIMKGVKNKTKKKKKNRQQVDDDVEVDPEIFRYTLERAMAEIPPGLRPGMRSWYDKQQKRKEAKKEKQKQKKTRQQKEDKKSKKNKKNNSYDQDFDLTKIDRRIREFINDSSISCYEFRPMPPYVRKQVHILAQAYNLLSEGTGKGADRYIVIRKTSETEIPENRRSIELYIEELQQTIDVVTSRQRKHNEPSELPKEKSRNKRSSKGKPKKSGNNKKQTTMPAPGTVVGDDVAPISQDNVGHRMLAAMGWRQGQALGTNNDGIVNPIMAVVRRNKLGLGL